MSYILVLSDERGKGMGLLNVKSAVSEENSHCCQILGIAFINLRLWQGQIYKLVLRYNYKWLFCLPSINQKMRDKKSLPSNGTRLVEHTTEDPIAL